MLYVMLLIDSECKMQCSLTECNVRNLFVWITGGSSDSSVAISGGMLSVVFGDMRLALQLK